MNKLTIIGNLCNDPTSRTTSEGKDVCDFSVAVNRKKKIQGQPEADFFRVSAWGKLGENCQKYLAKGRKVAVVGSVSVRTYQANDGTTRASMDVSATDVEFLTSTGGNTAADAAPSQETHAQETEGGFTAVETDELPF